MKNVLFVCVENACRSQMAQAFACAFGKGVISAYSAGSRPAVKVNPDAVEVMREEGIDISEELPKGIQALPLKQFDYIVTMGCKDSCPSLQGLKRLDWKIDDPRGHDMVYFRRVRNDIREKVEALIETIRGSLEPHGEAS